MHDKLICSFVCSKKRVLDTRMVRDFSAQDHKSKKRINFISVFDNGVLHPFLFSLFVRVRIEVLSRMSHIQVTQKVVGRLLDEIFRFDR